MRMSKSALLLAMAMALGGSSPGNSGLKPNEPDYKRKKCKSCKYINEGFSGCDMGHWTSPKSQACWQYLKRK